MPYLKPVRLYKEKSMIDLKKYQDFVEVVTSDTSNDVDVLISRIRSLVEDAKGLNADNPVNLSLLLTAGLGLGSEGGEFQEIVKKIFFQGKPLTEENVFHMKRELGDIVWYWANACRALGLDPNDVISENIRKLESRYPGGAFDAHYSENRKQGDL
jgi:NTP pyrophosphatase (non-canonical NTP hydrolase)